MERLRDNTSSSFPPVTLKEVYRAIAVLATGSEGTKLMRLVYINFDALLNFFVFSRELDKSRVEAKVGEPKVKQIDQPNELAVGFPVRPEMSLSAPSYEAKLLLEINTGEVLAAHCTCKGGAACKHLVSALAAAEHLASQPRCTEVAAAWRRPALCDVKGAKNANELFKNKCSKRIPLDADVCEHFRDRVVIMLHFSQMTLHLQLAGLEAAGLDSFLRPHGDSLAAYIMIRKQVKRIDPRHAIGLDVFNCC